MFNYISGSLTAVEPGIAVIECSGIGFEIHVSSYTLAALNVGEKAKLFTYTYIHEDVFDIYGFSEKNEKRCFEMLIGVSGVGPKAAISILSACSPDALVMAIISEDTKTLCSAQGIGKKIAMRIILELKDKMAKEAGNGQKVIPAGAVSVNIPKSNASEAIAALTVLGYSSSEINNALRNTDISGLGTEDIIKYVLKQMLK